VRHADNVDFLALMAALPDLSGKKCGKTAFDLIQRKPFVSDLLISAPQAMSFSIMLS